MEAANEDGTEISVVALMPVARGDEIITATATDGSGASDYVKAKANEIEDLAKQLRATKETSETNNENLQVEETEKVN